MANPLKSFLRKSQHTWSAVKRRRAKLMAILQAAREAAGKENPDNNA